MTAPCTALTWAFRCAADSVVARRVQAHKRRVHVRPIPHPAARQRSAGEKKIMLRRVRRGCGPTRSAPLACAGASVLSPPRHPSASVGWYVHRAVTKNLGCPQDPKENSFLTQKGTHEANLMLECSNRSEASSVGGPSD